MKDDLFECSSCGLDFARESAVNECRRCHRNHCDACLDENDLCVPCGEGTTRK